MDQDTVTGSPSSASTATFSVPESTNLPTILSPTRARQQAAMNDEQRQGIGQQAAPEDDATAQRWSEGTFGDRSPAAGPGSAEGTSSASYSGKSQEATTAQAATARVVLVKDAEAKEESGLREDKTSADAAEFVQSIDPAAMEQMRSSTRSAKSNRGLQ